MKTIDFVITVASSLMMVGAAAMMFYISNLHFHPVWTKPAAYVAVAIGISFFIVAVIKFVYTHSRRG